jgi:hypothetical protein
VTRRFAAGWAERSDSYLGNRSWVSSALGTQVELPHGMGSTKSDERPGLWVIRVNRSSDTRVIISPYQIEKAGDDHPCIWRYTARRVLVIFDHPYNAE